MPHIHSYIQINLQAELYLYIVKAICSIFQPVQEVMMSCESLHSFGLQVTWKKLQKHIVLVHWVHPGSGNTMTTCTLVRLYNIFSHGWNECAWRNFDPLYHRSKYRRLVCTIAGAKSNRYEHYVITNTRNGRSNVAVNSNHSCIFIGRPPQQYIRRIQPRHTRRAHSTSSSSTSIFYNFLWIDTILLWTTIFFCPLVDM